MTPRLHAVALFSLPLSRWLRAEREEQAQKAQLHREDHLDRQLRSLLRHRNGRALGAKQATAVARYSKSWP